MLCLQEPTPSLKPEIMHRRLGSSWIRPFQKKKRWMMQGHRSEHRFSVNLLPRRMSRHQRSLPWCWRIKNYSVRVGSRGLLHKTHRLCLFLKSSSQKKSLLMEIWIWITPQTNSRAPSRVIDEINTQCRLVYPARFRLTPHDHIIRVVWGKDTSKQSWE